MIIFFDFACNIVLTFLYCTMFSFRLRVVSERADDSEKTLQITIPETPGSFRAMYSKIWPRNVTEFSYRYESNQEANVFISFQPSVLVENDFEAVMDDLNGDNFHCTDLTHNELAKTHVRHLAGGRSGAPNERLFRFHFPEVSLAATKSLADKEVCVDKCFCRYCTLTHIAHVLFLCYNQSPGALQRFLEALNMKWNISLFHYRNYGDDFGRVLVGIQQNHGTKCEGMNKFLQELGYQYIEETQNPAYSKFLRTKPLDE